MNQNNSTIVLALGDGDNGFVYSFQGPIDLTGATLTYVVEYDAGAAAEASTEGGNPNVAFQAWDSMGGAQWWECASWGIIADQDTTYSCSGFTVKAADSQSSANVRLFIGAKAGTATIKSATLQLAQ
ncbi:MAG TPA: hypothetical protein DIW64_14715 [Cellvibrio sp.]|nr:hypothetical protein [Cellvibrio sp.]